MPEIIHITYSSARDAKWNFRPRIGIDMLCPNCNIHSLESGADPTQFEAVNGDIITILVYGFVCPLCEKRYGRAKIMVQNPALKQTSYVVG